MRETANELSDTLRHDVTEPTVTEQKNDILYFKTESEWKFRVRYDHSHCVRRQHRQEKRQWKCDNKAKMG